MFKRAIFILLLAAICLANANPAQAWYQIYVTNETVSDVQIVYGTSCTLYFLTTYRASDGRLTTGECTGSMAMDCASASIGQGVSKGIVRVFSNGTAPWMELHLNW